MAVKAVLSERLNKEKSMHLNCGARKIAEGTGRKVNNSILDWVKTVSSANDEIKT